MINIDLTEEEYNLIINYRKGKYNIDITQEEYEMIISSRNGEVKVYEKYIENIEKLENQDNVFVSQKAAELLLSANKLRSGEMTLDEYKNIDDITHTYTDKDTKFKIGCLNYIKNAIALHYPN